MRIVIVTGASGGHIFPAVATANQLYRQGNNIFFLINNRPLERSILDGVGFEYKVLHIKRRTFFELAWIFFESLFFLKRYSPDAVCGFGGYIQVPTILAARLCRIPILVHEQNVVLGRATRIAARWADRVVLSFAPQEKGAGAFTQGQWTDRVMTSGNPIRTELLKRDRAEALSRFGFRGDLFTISILGGSQGAHKLNEVASRLNLSDDVQVIHTTGWRDFEGVKSEYKRRGLKNRYVASFIEEIGAAMSASDLIITRAGATTIAELAYLGKPALLVPYPYARGHQLLNARLLASVGGARIIEERGLTIERLESEIKSLMQNRALLGRMGEASLKLARPEAAARLAEMIMELGFQSTVHSR